ncbi:MAG: hypothetical protein VR64_22985 [Desulfatitalea sp. BRH_c12]|nr:MAG: hypothetical protein VR64_22985 [Desulfatitalea sp. BRH_c12]
MVFNFLTSLVIFVKMLDPPQGARSGTIRKKAASFAQGGWRTAFAPITGEVVRRIIHTTADFSLAQTVRFSPDADGAMLKDKYGTALWKPAISPGWGRIFAEQAGRARR